MFRRRQRNVYLWLVFALFLVILYVWMSSFSSLHGLETLRFYYIGSLLLLSLLWVQWIKHNAVWVLLPLCMYIWFTYRFFYGSLHMSVTSGFCCPSVPVHTTILSTVEQLPFEMSQWTLCFPSLDRTILRLGITHPQHTANVNDG
jgi:hypothetical protein